MKIKFLLFCLTICSISAFAQTQKHTLMHDGELREYDVHLPEGYVVGQALPMVINMHGLGSDVAQQTFYAGFVPIAERENFIVVHPQGLVRDIGGPSAHWNAYFGTDVDDLGFLNKLIDQVHADYNIDLAKVYSTGMSNGGYMSYVLACELSDRIAAIASVTGAMTVTLEPICEPGRAVPVMEIHGTADNVVEYDGNLFSLSAQEAIDFWVANNGCDIANKTSTDLPDVDIADNSTATLDIYPDCNEGTEVQFYTIHDGGHTWPGALHFGTLGNTNKDFNASEVIWEFFNRFTHPNPAPAGTVNTDELSQQLDLTISPNPFSEYLMIQNKSQEQLTFHLTNILGQQLTATNMLGAMDYHQLQLSHLDNGMYLLVIENDKERIVKRVLKQ